jgi:hypothetical protein
MAGLVKFTRTHNRTAKDVFNNMILPTIPLAMNDLMQKMTYFNKHNHRYQNRTGACEYSITWIPAVIDGNVIKGALVAGGISKAKYTYTMSPAYYYDKQRRLRVFIPKKPRVIRRGQAVNVNYAAFLELKGYPVLKQGFEKYRGDGVNIIGAKLRATKTPRMYTFKYTGQTADIYGGEV